MTNEESNQNKPDVDQENNGNKIEENIKVGSHNTQDEPITDAQRAYLKTLADEAGKSADENISKVEASKQIEELQQKQDS